MRQSYEHVQNELHSIVEMSTFSPKELAELSYDKVQDLLSWYQKVAQRSYIEKDKQSKDFVEKWLRNDAMSIVNKVETLLLNDKKDICLNEHKDIIIDTLSSSHCHMYAFVSHVLNERITLSLDDLRKLDVMFARHLSRRSLPMCLPSMACDDDDDDNSPRLSMNKWEALMVNCCKVFYDQLSKEEITGLLHNYVRVSDPRKFHMPIRYKCFEGDFLSELSKYYEERGPLITLVVNYRRNISVIVNDDMSKCYDYNTFTNRSITLAKCISIEMPYMCYAYVDKVEVDCVLESYNKTPSLHLWNEGTDYIACRSTDVAEEENTTNHDHDDGCSIVTLSVSKNVKGPASYVVARFGEIGESRYTYIKSIRLYGSAVTFV